MPHLVQYFRNARRLRNLDDSNRLQHRNGPVIGTGNHRVPGLRLALAARMGLRHVRRAAHLRHALAACAFLRRHVLPREHTRQHRRRGPEEHHANEYHGSGPSHNQTVNQREPDLK